MPYASTVYVKILESDHYVVSQTAIIPPQNTRMTPKKIRKTTTFSSGLSLLDTVSKTVILSKSTIEHGIMFPSGDLISRVLDWRSLKNPLRATSCTNSSFKERRGQ